MIRMLLLLCAGIFVTLQVGGQDRGQVRFGLMETARAPAPATTEADAPQMLMAAEASTAPPPMQVVFAPAQPVVSPAVTPAVIPQERVLQAETAAFVDSSEVMYVTGRAVNVRSGPSTRDGVVGRVTRGEQVSVVSVETNGWARVRIEGDGVDGYMAMNFLSDAP